MKRSIAHTAAIATLATCLAGSGSAQAEGLTAEDMAGSWASFACELRPGPMHVKRAIEIRADGTWSGAFAYFSGPECDAPTMTFEASGPYTLEGASDVAAKTEKANFVIADAAITVHEPNTAGYLNSGEPGTCGGSEWAEGVRQEITETGCAVFGMAFPVTEHEIVRVSDDYLFFGARPLDGGGLDSEERRPAAFQVPMVPAR